MVILDRFRPDRGVEASPRWYLVDAILALTLGYVTVDSLSSEFYVSTYGRVEGWWWVVALAPSALLLLRRRFPAAALYLPVPCYLVAGLEISDGNLLLPSAFTPYTVALSRPPRTSAILVAGAALTTSAVAFYGPDGAQPWGAVVMLALSGGSWLIGTGVRHTRHQVGRLSAEAHAADVRAAEGTHQALVIERGRIARELHDAVGHAVTVMVMQAGAYRLQAEDDRTREQLREIERVGRTALADLDRMLGLLDAEHDDAVPLGPTHGLEQLNALITGIRAAGTTVHLEDTCDGALDPTTERPTSVAAYRITQEALTNVVKHAGRSASAVVAVECSPQELVLTVTDDGRGPGTPAPSRGRGLAGMRQRAELLGGMLEAGTPPTADFTVADGSGTHEH